MRNNLKSLLKRARWRRPANSALPEARDRDTTSLSRNSDESVVEQSLSYWERIRGDRPAPQRSDFDPVDVPHLLPHVIFFEVVDGGADFRFRVIGDVPRASFFENYTGRLMSTLPHVTPDGQMLRNLRDAVRGGRPVRTPIDYVGPNDGFIKNDEVLLPFTDPGGRVTHILTIFELVDTRRA